MKLDKIDKKIINLLAIDGRMSCADIAREVGYISERSIRYRMERLVKEKIIQISAIPNPQSLGFTVVADVFIEVEPSMVIEIAHKIADFDRVTYVACSTGQNDISIQIVAKSNPELYSFVTEVIARINGVRKTSTSIVPMIIKNPQRWELPASLFEEEIPANT